MSTESIFVSYSSVDRPFALAFAKELLDLGVNVWIDQLGIKLGENWDNAIEEALENSNTFLLLISPTSVESKNVQDEVNMALKTDKKFIPVLIKQCNLPMRWDRKEYADLTQNPEKGLKSIISYLGLDERVAQKLKNILSLIGVSESSLKKIDQPKGEQTNKGQNHVIRLEDLLVSEAEINRATLMHKKGIKKNWQLIILVAIGSLLLLAGLLLIETTLPAWMIVLGSLSLNLLSIRPYGGIKRRLQNIDLMELLNLKRERLERVINKLGDSEIENFNNEFLNYIKI